ncbi:MAG: asparaginase [Gemmatimonadota bacterium]|jgi:L-asparaginase II|nr:asparaginase [Gemmatimonadota bacterium]MDP6528157.1 asparaginase [Gemmatimonadota bacterium]MDP6801767.1 asparaginase [Gemmatimonadota bacterium]MDP7031157.1 asparaginase [Gemmatimonadota bacterium]
MKRIFEPWMIVERGGFPESRHRGILAVIDDSGRVLASLGDPSWVSFLRSSAKMFQALPLVESGTADALGLDDRQLAVCCASHSSEPFHLRAVEEILSRAGLLEADLQCGPHEPVHEPTWYRMIRAGETPGALHNNCSGKHAGMLAVCRHRGWETEGYLSPDHPLQREIRTLLAEYAGVDPDSVTHATDGCGLPTFRLPVESFARALAKFAAGKGPDRWRGASARIFRAMTSHPEMVGGTGRFCTEVVRVANRPLLAKTGAEGFYAAAWTDDDGRGRGLVAKAEAGDDRSRYFAVAGALRSLGVLDDAGLAALAPFHSAPLVNRAGTEVGRFIRAEGGEAP